MYPTSADFQIAVGAPTRRAFGRVTFDITDVTAYSDVSSITTSTEATGLSVKAQLTDRIRTSKYNIATLETNRFKLDGSMSFPDDVLANNGEVGFVSNNLCDSSGVFASPPTITTQFNSTHSSAGVTITFDLLNEEYATDFVVSAYDGSNALITTVTVTGNTDIVAQPLGQLLNYKKLVFTINKWSVGDRRARVTEVDFGIVRVYTDDNLVNLRLSEELDLIGSTLPSAEFFFEIDNSDRAFNILNPTGFYKYLQQRQKIFGEIGIELAGGSIEYVPTGTYYLDEWISNEGSLTASFTARTALDLMTGFSYENLTVVSQSLLSFATNVFAAAGIPPASYSIDAALGSITTNSLVEKTTCKDVIQMIAMAGCANVWVGRDSVIKIVCMPSTPGTTQGTILEDNAYAEPLVTLQKITKRVDVTYWTALNTSAVTSATSAGVTDGQLLTVDNNKLINTSARALAVGNWIIQQSNYRARYATNWRGDPAYALGDVIEIENDFGVSLKSIVTKQEVTYQGYLQARTESKGVPN